MINYDLCLNLLTFYSGHAITENPISRGGSPSRSEKSAVVDFVKPPRASMIQWMKSKLSSKK